MYGGVNASVYASILNPTFNPGDGIICTSRVGINSVVVTVANVTNTPKTPTGQPWRVYIYKTLYL